MSASIPAKKSLGQNFLVDQQILETLVQTALVDIPIIEIGPGKGALTAQLLEAGHQVVSIEKDHRLIDPLQQQFSAYIQTGQLQIIAGDALVVTPESLGYTTGLFQIIANLPYYITGRYIRTMLESSVLPAQAVLVLQKEVVERIVATNNKESILSISVKSFATPCNICTVHRTCFLPVPRVDSAILQLTDISHNIFTDTDITSQQFFAIVKSGFASKRKTLANNLKTILQEKNLSWQNIATQIGCTMMVRPEKLSVDQWVQIARIIG